MAHLVTRKDLSRAGAGADGLVAGGSKARMLRGFLMGVRCCRRGMCPDMGRGGAVLRKQDRRTRGRYKKPSQHENHVGGSAHEEECGESRASSV